MGTVNRRALLGSDAYDPILYKEPWLARRRPTFGWPHNFGDFRIQRPDRVRMISTLPIPPDLTRQRTQPTAAGRMSAHSPARATFPGPLTSAADGCASKVT